MRNNWLRRMIWSYIPIFLSIGCFLFFVFFQVLTEQNKRDAQQANSVFTRQVQHHLDSILQSIDQSFTMEMLQNEWIRGFFDAAGSRDIYLEYRVGERLQKLKQVSGLIDSVYLVRFGDGLIYSGNVLNQREPFEDAAFIEQVKKEALPAGWTDRREFREFSQQPLTPVVTLVRRLPAGSDQGIVVVNVGTAQLERKIREMYNDPQRFVSLYDRQGKPLYPSVEEQAAGAPEISSTVLSPYTGWSIRSGLVEGTLFQVTSALSSVWIYIGLGAFTLGIASILYITRRNYRPIRELMAHIHATAAAASGGAPSTAPGATVDEFAFIGMTFDRMLEQSDQFRQRYEDDVRVRRKTLFHQWMSGAQPVTGEEWSQAMELFGMPAAFGIRRVLIVEIDECRAFETDYSRGDQELLKFVIHNALQELMDTHGLAHWGEWTQDCRLSSLVSTGAGEDAEQALLDEVYGQLQDWVAQHLRLSITVGMGGRAEHPSMLHLSAQQAQQTLQYKAVMGLGSRLHWEELGGRSASQGELLKYTPLLQRMLDSFGIQEEIWTRGLAQFFDSVIRNRLPRESIVVLLHDWLYTLDQELRRRARVDLGEWQSVDLPGLREAAEELETAAQMQEAFTRILTGVSERLQTAQGNSRSREIMRQLQEYITANYANPDLSLELLGQEFGLHPKYVSQLFKSESGTNFIDFLIDVRMRHAMTYLLETELPVQEIAERVGYANAISFRRTFKKVVGLSPGDYRKQKGSGS